MTGGGGVAGCAGTQAGRKGRPQERPTEPRALEPPQADAEPDGGSAEAAPSVEAPAAEAQEQHEAEQVEQVEQETEQVEQEEGQVGFFPPLLIHSLSLSPLSLPHPLSFTHSLNSLIQGIMAEGGMEEEQQQEVPLSLSYEALLK